jgi:hypothetical protein
MNPSGDWDDTDSRLQTVSSRVPQTKYEHHGLAPNRYFGTLVKADIDDPYSVRAMPELVYSEYRHCRVVSVGEHALDIRSA